MVKKAPLFAVALIALFAMPSTTKPFNKSSAIIAASALSTISGLYLLSTISQQKTKKKKISNTLIGTALTVLGIAGMIKGDKQANPLVTLDTKSCPHGDSAFCI